MFECLVSSWWNYLEMIRMCGLAGGGVLLGVGFEVSKTHTIPSSNLHLHLCLGPEDQT